MAKNPESRCWLNGSTEKTINMEFPYSPYSGLILDDLKTKTYGEKNHMSVNSKKNDRLIAVGHDWGHASEWYRHITILSWYKEIVKSDPKKREELQKSLLEDDIEIPWINEREPDVTGE